MLNINKINNPYGDDKVIAACSIFGMMDTSGNCFSGRDIITAIGNMNVRGNGLGGGFGVYGIYPDYADKYAFHIMYEKGEGKEETENFLRNKFYLVHAEEVPTHPAASVNNPPVVWRYFLDVNAADHMETPAEDYIVDRVMDINTGISGAYVFSSGKNMGVFKGVGYPEDIADYFMLDDYNGYLWTAHGRFPTNTRAWWGGAHPFNILDWTVVHNGEISSYGTNRRYLEQYGYNCTLETDTEVIAYAVDLLTRKQKLPMEIVAKIFAPPFWEQIKRMPDAERELSSALRQVYGSLLMNGPFTVIIAREGEMIGLTDRIRLRPLTVGIKKDMLFLSSEESAIRLICPDLDDAWIPSGGEPVIGKLGSTPVAKHSKRVENTAKVK
jgi:glutamate synthase domain-containing protein 1